MAGPSKENSTHESEESRLDSYRRDALASSDPRLVEGNLYSIQDLRSIPDTDRARAIQDIARRHNDTTNVMCAVFRIIPHLDRSIHREIAYAVLRESPTRERDVIIAAAAVTLVNAHDFNKKDVAFILAALSHPLDHVRKETERAIGYLGDEEFNLLQWVVASFPPSKEKTRFNLIIDSRKGLSSLSHPPRPPNRQE